MHQNCNNIIEIADLLAQNIIMPFETLEKEKNFSHKAKYGTIVIWLVLNLVSESVMAKR